MFWIQYRNAQNQLVEVALNPGPSAVDYPDADAATVKATVDGAIVIQRPLRDSRPRKWLWKGHSKSDANYVALWALLESLRTRVRTENALEPTVGVWEDVSDLGGFNRTDGQGGKIYTQVKIVQATRSAQDRGPVMYESTLEFYVTDPNYQNF